MIDAATIIALARQSGVMLSTAESCTGGLIISQLTDIAGSSDVVDRGFITYSNAAKSELLGVPQDMIIKYGAVSQPVAEAMATGACLASARGENGNLALSVTGIAGPGGGSADKPVGTVWFCLAIRNRDDDIQITSWKSVFQGNRQAVRLAAVEAALSRIEIKLKQQITDLSG